jgi:PAS domain S-box-containing protein
VTRSSIQILHVDDDPNFTALTADCIERANDQFTVQTAPTVSEGLSIIEAQSIDCIISDYDMPGQNGIEFLKTIRDTRPDMPFILFTGEGNESVASDAISAGVTEYKRKETGVEQFELLANRIEIAVEQYRTERRLEDLTKRFELALSQTDTGIWELDLETDTLYWDETSERLFGYEPTDSAGAYVGVDARGSNAESTQQTPTGDHIADSHVQFRTGYDDRIHPDDLERVSEQLAHAIDTGEQYQADFRVQPPEEPQRWVQARGVVEYDDSGNPTRVVGIQTDITDRKERERELQNLKERFELAVDGAKLGVWDWNPQTDEVQFNDTWATMLGYDPDEIGSELAEWEQRVHPEDLTSVEAALESHLAGETDYYDTEHRMQTADGDWKWIRDIGRVFERDDHGRPIRAVGIHIDISERKAVETELTRAREQLREIIDLVPDPIFVKSYDGEYLLANETTATMYGMTPADVEGAHERDVIPAVEEAAVFRADDQAVIESGKAQTISEAELTTADGEIKILRTTKIPYEVPGTGEDAVLGYARDITELKQYEQMLERQRDNLKLLNGVVRHDIRNDLQLVRGHLRMIEDSVEDTGYHHLQKAIENVHSSINITDTAREVTETLLETDSERVPTNLRHALLTVIESVRSTDDSAVITIDGSIPDTEVLADDMLNSVFRNLLTNAITHNDKNTPEVTITAATTNGTAKVDVADNGPGIPEHRREAIFDKNECGLESAGTGLGLYLVQTLVDRYGGAVQYETNDPKGSVFTVTLPVANDESSMEG